MQSLRKFLIESSGGIKLKAEIGSGVNETNDAAAINLFNRLFFLQEELKLMTDNAKIKKYKQNFTKKEHLMLSSFYIRDKVSGIAKILLLNEPASFADYVSDRNKNRFGAFRAEGTEALKLEKNYLEGYSFGVGIEADILKFKNQYKNEPHYMQIIKDSRLNHSVSEAAQYYTMNELFSILEVPSNLNTNTSSLYLAKTSKSSLGKKSRRNEALGLENSGFYSKNTQKKLKISRLEALEEAEDTQQRTKISRLEALKATLLEDMEFYLEEEKIRQNGEKQNFLCN